MDFKLNVFKECRVAHLGLLQCPPFLFILMGILTIFSMIGTYLLASQYIEEPQLAALLVSGVAAMFFIVGNAIIAGFNKIAEANRMKSEFISIISHQLRSPLSIFKWTLDIIGSPERNNLTKEEESNFIATLRETSDRMVQMVNSLLEVGRIETGRLILKKEPVNLISLTEDVIKIFSAFAESSNVEIKLEAEAGLPNVIADPEHLRMVVQNLIDNAIRYTRKKSVVVISIGRAKKNGLTWAIRDQGIGIPKEYKKYIFGKFFRAPNVMSRQTQGSGLGLYIAKAVIEELGGKIDFESVDSQGTVFWFTLPIK